MLFKLQDKSSPPSYTHYAKLYPQNGDRIVAIDSVTSLHPMYSCSDSSLRSPLFNTGNSRYFMRSAAPPIPWAAGGIVLTCPSDCACLRRTGRGILRLLVIPYRYNSNSANSYNCALTLSVGRQEGHPACKK